MNNEEIIKQFYKAFSIGDATGMTACYHKEVVFQDPAFGRLEGERAHKMWEMLLSEKTAGTSVTFDNITATSDHGSADWVAKYSFGEKQRSVTNRVSARFKFKDGKIIEHIDTFDLWKWSQQAMGPIGYLLGWSSFMRNKIQNTTNSRLDSYLSHLS